LILIILVLLGIVLVAVLLQSGSPDRQMRKAGASDGWAQAIEDIDHNPHDPERLAKGYARSKHIQSPEYEEAFQQAYLAKLDQVADGYASINKGKPKS
jgi:hypothetical protein